MGKNVGKNPEVLNVTEQENGSHMERFKDKRIKAHVNIIVISALMAAVAALVGYGIDSALGTNPVGIVAAVVLSFPVAQFVIIKRLRSL